MSLSNSYDFVVTRNDIIRDALLEIGAIDAGEPIDSTILSDVARQLNMLVKLWQVKYNLWRFSDITITLDGSQSYTIGPSGADVTAQRPLRITQARRVETSGYEIPIDVVSLQEYKDQPLKTASGSAVMCTYVPELTRGVLYVWPASSTGSIVATALFPLMDMDTAADNPQFPVEWSIALVKNLAVIIHPQFPGTTLKSATIAVAESSLSDLEAFDTDPTSIYFMPRRS